MQDEDPKIWGSHFWFVMRKIASQYPESHPTLEVRNAAQLFYQSLTELLPCRGCRQHYQELVRKYPVGPNLDSRLKLKRWVETIRHEVDKIVAKQKGSIIENMSGAQTPVNTPNRQIAQSIGRTLPPGRGRPNVPTQARAVRAAAQGRTVNRPIQPARTITTGHTNVRRRVAGSTATTTSRSVQPARGCSSCGQRR